MSDIRTATRQHYDRYSYDFETSVHEEMQLDGSQLGRALGLVKAGDVVVDAGCGTGLVSRLARRSTPAAAVVGLDLSLGSLRRTKARSPGVQLTEGDILNLPLRTDSVDLVISRGVIMTTGAPDRAFAELARATKPDGHLFVRVYARAHWYAWAYEFFGPICRGIASVPGGKTLLALLVVPAFWIVAQLGIFFSKGRFAWMSPTVLWNLFADQLLVPHNSFHDADEVKSWGTRAGCRCIGEGSVTFGQQIEFLFVKGR